jgi:threonine aldolase
MDPVVDLRSDTVTRPSAAMREAMATAEVGDDVWGEDPTVNRLQERAASLTGKEAALFVPSGTMGNQLALRAHTEPGDQLVCHADAHVLHYEGGAPAALSGLQVSTVTTPDGSMPWAGVEARLHPDDVHCAPPRLVAFENTHNRCGGTIHDQAILEDCAGRASARGLATHLDGARLANAAIATGKSLADLCAPVDSVSICFSKGLGAPVGSVLAGSAGFVRRARRFRKQWGGGMRQAGILAAAASFALDHHFDRLAEDHDRARVLAAELDHPQWRLRGQPRTNIVLFDLFEGPDSASWTRRLAERGVLVSAFGPRILRMVTHLDVDDSGLERAIETINALGRNASGRSR